MIFDQNNIG